MTKRIQSVLVFPDSDSALVGVAYDGTQYSPPRVDTESWKRTAQKPEQVGFKLEILLEGYRPFKDQWVHSTEHFDTMEAALERRHQLNMLQLDQLDAELGLTAEYKDQGWYGFSLEDIRVYEYTASGVVYQWERKYS